MEAALILQAADRSLRHAGNMPYHNPEIHFSGNWSRAFKPVESGGNFDQQSYESAVESGKSTSVRDQKRRYQRGGEADWPHTNMYGYLYATTDPGRFVTLPTRPKGEIEGEWDHITPTPPEDIQKIAEITTIQAAI